MDNSGVLETLASYVPTHLLRLLLANPVPARTPTDTHFQSATLYAEIGGLDDLLARLIPSGEEGTRRLTQILNAYFNLLVDFVKIEGGDIMSLSGDKALVLWPAEHESSRRASVSALVSAAHRAAQCALSLQKMLHDYDAGDEGQLGLRMAVSAGKVYTASVGGALGRWEFLTSGVTVAQTFGMVREAEWGDILLSPQAYALLRTQCVGQELPDGNFRLENVRFPLPSRTLPPPVLEPEMAAPLRAYIPGAVLNSMTTGQTGWLAELRNLSILSINLPNVFHRTALDTMHTAMRTMQRALYRYAGSVNKLQVGDNGMVLTAALGLPPLSHPDDPQRAVQAAALIVEELQKTSQSLNVGIATGPVFCTSVGSARRREHAMIGETVTRARQLMAAAQQPCDGISSDALTGIRCDAATYQATQEALSFDAIPATGESSPVYVPRRTDSLP
ncbi:MAG: adenylate/guanylate cyclase domain-containing protein [Anaerolineae bacterium]|nr:adenylate/guanylate cyclase domain-containing protein [Anaerolineae bacterium]